MDTEELMLGGGVKVKDRNGTAWQVWESQMQKDGKICCLCYIEYGAITVMKREHLTPVTE